VLWLSCKKLATVGRVRLAFGGITRYYHPTLDMAKSLKLPPDLEEVAELRAKQLGYPSWSAYVKGLIRYDAMVQGTHDVTLPIAAMSPAEQDKMDAKLLNNTKEGVGQRGQFLKRLLKKD
jgi:hypothetical protein